MCNYCSTRYQLCRSLLRHEVTIEFITSMNLVSLQDKIQDQIRYTEDILRLEHRIAMLQHYLRYDAKLGIRTLRWLGIRWLKKEARNVGIELDLVKAVLESGLAFMED